MDAREFQHPPKQYREIPFWSWNDDLDPAELRRQIALMDDAGWGGFFMHARIGLKTPYLGQRWMECVTASVDEARRRGMGAWLYDEDTWPSGFAGGLSVTQDPGYRQQYLVCKLDNRTALLPHRLATFVAREEGGHLRDIHPDPNPILKNASDRILQFYPQAMHWGVPWFNGYAYLSLLNPKAVRAFIDTTHEAYADLVGADFGGAVPGIFTDEPCYLFLVSEGGVPALSVPWVEGFEDHFRKKRGYDLLPHLPALVVNMQGYEGIRYDFWRTLTELFVESYSKQIYAWCNEHNIAYTGHVMAEDTMLRQIQWSGAAMLHYPHMHIPGIDKLDRIINAGPGTVLTVKQLDSVVCQLGKQRALCENFGCSGQDFAHTGRKWIADWAYVLGITLNNPHLSLYTIRGERKHDFPQNIFFQQPWWPENRLIADYVTRLSYVLSQGRRATDILVLHPMGSAWAVYRPDAQHAVDELDRSLNALLMTLMRNQRDFHLGDELLMGSEGTCEASVVKDAGGARVVVGQMAYKVVVIPPSVTLTPDTARLLEEFAAAGGHILAMEPRPALVNGRPAPEPPVPANARTVSIDSLPAALDDVLPFDVRIANRPDIWAHHRHIDDKECYFLANTDQDHGVVATVSLRGGGRLEEWDPAGGQTRPLPSRQQRGVTEVTLDFAPAGSHLLLLHPGEPAIAQMQAPERVLDEITLSGAWQLVPGGPNSLTLDTAQVQIGDSTWSEPMHILEAHSVVAEAGIGSPFALRFSVAADVAPRAPVFLAVEAPEKFEITVNGKPIANTDTGWWVDTSFRKINLGPAIKAGQNEIVLRGAFARGSELESIYLVGSFGVAGRRLSEENRVSGQVFDRYAPDFHIAAQPETIAAAGQPGSLPIDLTQHGFPFFAGRASLRQSLTLVAKPAKAVLQIGGLRAAVAHVRVNGKDMGTVAWQPHVVDISKGLRAGKNTIEIEIVGTLRNLLGPHHRKGGDLVGTGPAQFRDKSRWTEDYILVPFGFEQAMIRIMALDRQPGTGRASATKVVR